MRSRLFLAHGKWSVGAVGKVGLLTYIAVATVHEAQPRRNPAGRLSKMRSVKHRQRASQPLQSGASPNGRTVRREGRGILGTRAARDCVRDAATRGAQRTPLSTI